MKSANQHPSPRVCFSSLLHPSFHLDPPPDFDCFCAHAAHTYMMSLQTARTAAGRRTPRTPFCERTLDLRRPRGRYGAYVPACDGCGVPPHVPHKNVHVCTVRAIWLAAPPAQKECIVYYRLLSLLAARKLGLGVLVVLSALASMPVVSLLPAF